MAQTLTSDFSQAFRGNFAYEATLVGILLCMYGQIWRFFGRYSGGYLG